MTPLREHRPASGTGKAAAALLFMYGTSALMALGAIMNAASPSFVERIAWTPVTILLVVTLWRAARLDAAGATLSAAPLSRQS